MSTNNIAELKNHIDEFGYCVVNEVIPKDQVALMHQRIENQSLAEKEQDVMVQDQVQTDDDLNQWVYMLINKGEIFQQLFTEPVTHQIVEHVLGPDFLLSDFSATITRPGNRQMGLHKDQWWMPESRMPGEPHNRPGNVDRGSVQKGEPTPSTSPIAPPVVCNVLWMISDFTVENGGTRIVPRSHLSGTNPDQWGDYDTVNATGKAGSAVIFEGRTWHAADLNTSDVSRYGITCYYCAPQFRQMLNFTYGMREEVVADLNKQKRDLLGFKPWGGYGATGDQHAESIVPGSEQVGVLGEGPNDNPERK